MDWWRDSGSITALPCTRALSARVSVACLTYLAVFILTLKSFVVVFKVFFFVFCIYLQFKFCLAAPNQNLTVSDSQQSFTNLTGLRPYTTYSISIAVLSSGGESLPSDPLLNVTLEAGTMQGKFCFIWF